MPYDKFAVLPFYLFHAFLFHLVFTTYLILNGTHFFQFPPLVFCSLNNLRFAALLLSFDFSGYMIVRQILQNNPESLSTEFP